MTTELPATKTRINNISQSQPHSEEMLDIKKILENLPILILGLENDGPVILYQDRAPWFKSDNNEEQTQMYRRFSIDTIILGIRSEYDNTISDIPAPDTKYWRSLVISISLPSKNVHEGFFQIILFIPRSILRTLPNLAILEDKLLQKVLSVCSKNTKISQTMVQYLKKEISDVLLYAIE